MHNEHNIAIHFSIQSVSLDIIAKSTLVVLPHNVKVSFPPIHFSRQLVKQWKKIGFHLSNKSKMKWSSVFELQGWEKKTKINMINATFNRKKRCSFVRSKRCKAKIFLFLSFDRSHSISFDTKRSDERIKEIFRSLLTAVIRNSMNAKTIEWNIVDTEWECIRMGTQLILASMDKNIDSTNQTWCRPTEKIEKKNRKNVCVHRRITR